MDLECALGARKQLFGGASSFIAFEAGETFARPRGGSGLRHHPSSAVMRYDLVLVARTLDQNTPTGHRTLIPL